MAAVNQKRVALVIGNADYAHATSIPNVANDVRGVSAKLREAGFDNLTELENLDFAAMRKALQQFGRAADGADIALVYYAGHGIEWDGENHLLPVDAKLEHDRDVAFETVSLQQLLRAMDGAGVLRLAILDACRDNPFRARMTNSAPRTRSLGKGLADVEPEGNALVVFSAKGGTVALDGAGPHSPFAAAMMECLAKPGLELGFLFRQVRDTVLKSTGRKQEPHLYGSLGAEAVYFVPPLPVPEPAPAPAPAAPAGPSRPDVFISYATADRARAEQLAQDLTADGYAVWWDSMLLGGLQFRKAIVSQLDAARAAIVIWTKTSVESDWVYDEACRARAADKLIPVRVAELDPKEIQPPFGALQTMVYEDFAKGRKGLHAALARHGAQPHTDDTPRQAEPVPVASVRPLAPTLPTPLPAPPPMPPVARPQLDQRAAAPPRKIPWPDFSSWRWPAVNLPKISPLAAGIGGGALCVVLLAGSGIYFFYPTKGDYPPSAPAAPAAAIAAKKDPAPIADPAPAKSKLTSVSENISAQVQWYGVYTATDTKTVDDPKSPTGARSVTVPIPPRTNGMSIPARELRFGMSYVLEGKRGREVTVKHIYRFPEPGMPDAKTGEFRSTYETERTATVGEPILMGWSFVGASSDQILIGTWSFEVRQNDRIVLDQRFDVHE